MDIAIDEALGNCPKYITVRDLDSFADAEPVVELEQLDMSSDDTLPSSVVSHITSSDNLWLGTSYLPAANSRSASQPHLGANHRGGRPGFVRVRADGKTLVIPDYSGNRHFTSLGNILSDASVGLTFVDFVSGDVLYLTGKATNLVGEQAAEVMPRAPGAITLVEVSGYTLVRNALPFRQPPGAQQLSPYSPPVRYLAEEQAPLSTVADVKAKLKDVQLHTDDLATFTFETSAPITVVAGQYAVLDTTSLIGQKSYQHMSSQGNEATLNDDGVRTW